MWSMYVVLNNHVICNYGIKFLLYFTAVPCSYLFVLILISLQNNLQHLVLGTLHNLLWKSIYLATSTVRRTAYLFCSIQFIIRNTI